MRALVDDADAQEECACDDSVIHHLKDGTLNAAPVESKNSERTAHKKQRDQTNEHQHAAGKSKNQELESRVNASGAAPDADEKKHRHEHQFPEHIEQKKVGRREEADHGHFSAEQRSVEPA